MTIFFTEHFCVSHFSGARVVQIFHLAQGDVGAAGLAAPTDHRHPHSGPSARPAAENHVKSGLGQQVGH